MTDPTSNIIFVESALIFELELDKGFDYTISVTASEGLRIERLKSRSNLSEQQILYRMSQQFSQEEKNKNADFVIENENGISELTKAVNFLLPILLTLPNRIFIDEIAETQ
jgi:dephospho-CoA kinase